MNPTRDPRHGDLTGTICISCGAAIDRAIVVERLEHYLERPILPGMLHKRQRTREALRRAREALADSPIGRGEWR